MEQQLTAISILALFETDKAQRASFVQDVITKMQDGTADPLKVHLQMKCMEDLVNGFIGSKKGSKEYKDLVLEAAQKHGKEFDYYNAKFSVKEVGTKYDYSVCEDVVMNELLAQQAGLKTRIDERAKFLQTIPESGMADPENGNMIYRAVKTSTTSVTVKLK